MNYFHLLWIIPLAMIIGVLVIRSMSWFVMGKMAKTIGASQLSLSLSGGVGEDPRKMIDGNRFGSTGFAPGGVSWTPTEEESEK